MGKEGAERILPKEQRSDRPMDDRSA